MRLASFSRIAVIGSSGSGKTTLARHIAEMADIPHIELDSMYWGRDWTPRSDFIERVRAMTLTDARRQPRDADPGAFESERNSVVDSAVARTPPP
jgi:ABC-type glutathione transport system ATPase component